MSSENVGADELVECDNIAASLELKSHLTDVATEEEIQLAIKVEGAGRLDRVGLNFAVRQGGEVYFSAGYSLYVDGNHALVGEYDRVANGLEGCNDVLSVNEERSYLIHHGGGVDRGKLEQAAVFEINHGCFIEWGVEVQGATVRTEVDCNCGRMYLCSSTWARTAPNSCTQQSASLPARVSSRTVGSAAASSAKRRERVS